MEDVRIILSVIWVALMLTYLLGDVLRIYAGDFTPGQVGGTQLTQTMLIVMAIIMLLPIVMSLLSLTIPYPAIRWVNIIVAIALFIFNIVGLPGYPGAYDKFLITVGLAINVLTVWYAWNWI
ncbi:hypothetical protein E2P47_02395 [Candidatus Bathyarchaeota archaeon]|nr:hypothetical protein E2P47_02395 [Candidatus Bathyarchaeota archaeon]